MKKFYFLLLLLIGSFVSKGQQLLFEPFNYTPDATSGLAAQSNSTWITVNTGDSILVTAGSLSFTGLPASTGNKVKFDGGGTDYYTPFTSQTTGSIYGSFILNLTSFGGLTTTGGYFTGFIQSASTSSFGATVWSRLSTTAGKYNIGVSTRSNSAVSWLATDLDLNTSYLIVMAYDVVTGTGNDVARLWLNPATGGAEPAPDATSVPATDLTSVARLFLRQDNATNTPFIEIDEYRVGTTWASVTPGGAPVSSLSSSSLTSFGNVCLNTTAGPNSFTITGTNLSSANITVASLGGFSFSTTAAGPYSSSLSLVQPGGAFSQQVFVNFTPTAVQSYNGNIVVGGGGATSINVAATGSGVNSAPTVTTGTASGITTNTAVAAGSITSNGCATVTTYGIEYSQTQGFANGSGTQVSSTNLSGSNFTSSLIGLAPNTTYYYKAFATSSVGTSWGAEMSFTTAGLAPTLSTTTLTGFGNVCVNTSAGPNLFTINGSNLTTANVTVGPLAGYSFSTTSGGSYSSTLTLIQGGGTYSQPVYVKFDPTVVQSYNGDIPVMGGGATGTTNVAVTGNGVNSAPTVSTGNATSITTTTATLSGTIGNIGCSPVSAYGIYYSTTNGFADGSGTQVPSTNLSGSVFSSNPTGLTPSTTYYFKAYATNAGGTSYGPQQSFVTQAPPPPVLSATTLNSFDSVCTGDSTAAQTFTVTGSNLTSAITVGALSGYRYSLTPNGVYSTTLTITPASGSVNRVVYVKLFGSTVSPTSHNGNIVLSGGGATAVNVAVTGTTFHTRPTVTTNGATNIRTTSATLNGRVGDPGCSNVNFYGFFFSSASNFQANYPSGNNWVQIGSPTPVNNADFTYELTGLLPNTTYYIKSFALNNGGPAYGNEISFTTAALPSGLTMAPNPVRRGHELSFSMTNLAQRYFGIELYNSSGQKVLIRNFNVQNGFINDHIVIPYATPPGVYYVRVINDTEVLEKKTILVVD